MECCSKCRFWLQNSDHSDDWGVCKADPPTIVAGLDRENNLVGYWPETHAEDWCGHFQIKQNT